MVPEAEGGRQPGKDTVFCNVHYDNNQGPTIENRNLVPEHFNNLVIILLPLPKS